MGLASEINNDPLSRGYAAMTDSEIVTDLNTAYRTRTRSRLSSSEIYEQINAAEFVAMTDANKQYVRDILGLGEGISVGPDSQARSVLIGTFGAQSTTINNLAAILTESITRARELGLGAVSTEQLTRLRLDGEIE